jgi:hypothetical protein
MFASLPACSQIRAAPFFAAAARGKSNLQRNRLRTEARRRLSSQKASSLPLHRDEIAAGAIQATPTSNACESIVDNLSEDFADSARIFVPFSARMAAARIDAFQWRE